MTDAPVALDRKLREDVLALDDRFAEEQPAAELSDRVAQAPAHAEADRAQHRRPGDET